MDKATIYTRPGCVKCRQTARKLTQLGIPVIEEQIDAPEHAEKIAEMRANGEAELPLVEATIGGENVRWTGFSAQLFDELKEHLKC